METKPILRTVYITQDHIDKGRQRHCSLCPGALAILDAFPELCDVKVLDLEIHYWVTNVTEVCVGPVPDELKKFIHNFDWGLNVKPTQFLLTLDL